MKHQIERLLVIAAACAVEHGMRTKELAQRLEVSAKTIHRDFEFLRDRLHLDVELDRSGGEFRWKARDAAEVLPLVTTLNRLTPCLNESI